MPVRINRNPSDPEMVSHLDRAEKSSDKTMGRLSSGWRISEAADDPAGLSISENLRSRIGSLNKEIDNTSQAIRKYDTADDTVNQLRSIANDLRSMAVGAANAGGSDASSRAAYQNAADRAVDSYNRIIKTATYNNANLLDGSEGSLVGLSNLPRIDLQSPDKASSAVERVDQALTELDKAQGTIGATQKFDLEARRSDLEVTTQNLAAADSQIRDADYSLEIATMIRDQIQVRAGVSLLAHANVTQNSVVSLMGG
jgi:flagellin